MAIKNEFLRACPNCGSTDVENKNGQNIDLGGDLTFQCNSCSFTGFFPEVRRSSLSSFRKNIRAKKLSS